jgi:hypothetical protein
MSTPNFPAGTTQVPTVPDDATATASVRTIPEAPSSAPVAKVEAASPSAQSPSAASRSTQSPSTANATTASPSPHAPSSTSASSATSTAATAARLPTDGRSRAKALALVRMSNAELERAFVRGVTPDANGLVGWEFRGHNTPPWFRLLGIQKFVKGFFADGDGGVWGYNSPVVQDGFSKPWRLKPSDDQPKRFGFYTVRPVDAAATDNRYLHALLLDYGQGGNPRLDPSAGLRDYLVQVDADDPDLLLGKAYYAVGPLRVPTFSFFVLDRHRAGVRELARRSR